MGWWGGHVLFQMWWDILQPFLERQEQVGDGGEGDCAGVCGAFGVDG